MIVMASQRVGNYLYLLPTRQQAVDIIWQGKDKTGRPFLDYIPQQLIKRKLETDKSIELVNGSLISLEGTKEMDRLIGQGPVGVVFSEFQSQTEDAWNYISPMLVENDGWAIFNGTARPVSEAPHFKGMLDTNRDNPAWFTAVLGRKDTGAVSDEQIEAERRAGRSEAFIAQEYDCDFYASSENILIPLHLIESAIDRNVSYQYAPKVAGIDVGYSLGGDPSAIVIRQGGKLLCMDETKSDDFNIIAGWAAKHLWEHGCRDVAIDGIGWGAGLKIPLQNLGFNVTSVNVAETAAFQERFNRRRDELWFAVREWFEQKQNCIPGGIALKQKLIAELSGVTYEMLRVSGKIKVEGKKDIKERTKHSPNIADALCLTFAVLPNWQDAMAFQPNDRYAAQPVRSMLL